MVIDDLLGRLEGVKGSTPQWSARCPAHDDRSASLTVAIGRDGQLLLTCWAGCSLDDIVHAMGAEIRDLFPSASSLDRTPKPAPSLAAMALPSDDEVVRYAERLQRSPDTLAMLFEVKGWSAGTCAVLELGLVGDRITIPMRDPSTHAIVNLLRYSPNGRARGPKMLAESGYPRIPFYALLPDSTGPVWIVEGEGDAISVAGVGLNVIGAPGASAKAKAEWLDCVRDRDVVVCMDNDEPGRKAAKRWARAAAERGVRSVRVVELDGPEGYDVGELVRELRDRPSQARERLLAFALAAPEWEPDVERVAPPLAPELSDETIDELKAGELVLRSVASVRSRAIVWLWRRRIPRGRVGVIFGPPGTGKSTLLALLIADVTRNGGRVLIASAEDDIETTIRPRLIAHDAAVERVTLLSTKASTGETLLMLPRDIDALADTMAGHDLVLIDPLSAHQDESVNSWQESSVRAQVFAPLMWHARRTDCTVIGIMHLNKSSGTDPLSRISGSGGYAGAARFVLLLGTHPSDVGRDDARLALVHVKASEGPKQHALTFRRSTTTITDDGVDVETPLLELVRDDERLSAESVLAVTDPDEAGSFTQAVDWLRYELADGPKPSKRLLAAARERGDFSERTLRKAKSVLGIKSERDEGAWLWVPPTKWT